LDMVDGNDCWSSFELAHGGCFLVLFKGGYNIIKMNARNDNPMRVLVPLLEFNLNARYQLGEFWV